MTPLSAALSGALLHFIWQGTVVVGLLWVVLLLLRKQTAAVRYGVNCVALALLAALPVITTFVLWTPSPAPLPLLQPGRIFVFGAPAISAFSWLSFLQQWTLPVWGIGVALFSLRMLWSCGQTFWLRRRGDEPEKYLVTLVADLALRMGVTGKVRVLISAIGFAGPCVIGWLRPVILVPASALAGLTTQQLEAVLAHELAHIYRADYLVNVLQTLVETLLFYHPAVWWISAAIRRERELCCDDLAVSTCGDAVTYARALTTLEKLRLAVPGLAMGSTSGPLLQRIQRIVGMPNHQSAPSRVSGMMALAAMLAFGAMDLNWAKAQARPAPASPAAQNSPGPVSAKPPVAPAAGAVKPPTAPASAPLAAFRADTETVKQEMIAVEAHAATLRSQMELLRMMAAAPATAADANNWLAASLASLKTQLAETVARRDQLKNMAAMNDRLVQDFLGDQVREAQSNVVALEARRAAAIDAVARSQMDAELISRTLLLNELQQKLSAVMADVTPEVESIVISGLTPEAEARLRSMLAIHKGSRLSNAVLREGFTTVNQFDRTLEFAVVMLADGLAELRIRR